MLIVHDVRCDGAYILFLRISIMQASEFFLIDTLTIQTTLLALYQVNICQGWKGQLYDVKRNAQQ